MTTAAQVLRMRKQREATYGLIEPVQPTTPAATLIASGVSDNMIGGNVTVFPLGVDGDLPTSFEVAYSRFTPGGGLGQPSVDTISPGVGGSFRIHSDDNTETSTWFYQVFAAV